MMRYHRLKHQFVTTLPDVLEAGVLYVSTEYATSAHLCCCGCGEEVVTPLTPTDWKMTFDGETVSLWPSVGNWYDKCRSHYVIEQNRVIPALPWSEERVEAEWQRDRAAKESYYAEKEPAAAEPSATLPTLPEAPTRWTRVKRWLKSGLKHLWKSSL